MTAMYYPALSADGWVSTPLKILDYLIADFYEAEASQSYLFMGSISSLPDILRRNNGDITRSATEVQATLTRYLSRFFTDVVVEAAEHNKLNDTDTPNDSFMGGSMRLYVTAVKDGQELKLYDLVRTTGTLIQDIRRIRESETL